MSRIINLLKTPQRIPSLLAMHTKIQLKRLQKQRFDMQQERQKLFDFLEKTFEFDAASAYVALQASDFKQAYLARKRGLKSEGFGSGISSDFDCEALYLLVRASRPETIVETGVLYGASSAHILQALAENGRGRLYSIDLPSQPGIPDQRTLVPAALQERWELLLGDSRQLLPELLDRLETVDIFHHDSLHTYAHMRWEYGIATPSLQPQGVLSSHDVLSLPFQANAFADFCREAQLQPVTFRNIGFATPS